MPRFSSSSKAVHITLCDELRYVMNEVIKHRDCKLLYGHRDEATQNRLYAEGRSKLRYPQSKHNTYPSDAVDVVPWPIPEEWGDLRGQDVRARDLEWKERVKFYELLAVIEYEAAKQGVKLRTGRDWDGDGDYRDQTFDDLVHVEVVRD